MDKDISAPDKNNNGSADISIENKEIKKSGLPNSNKPILTTIKRRGRKSFKETDVETDMIHIPEDEVLFQKQYYSISTVAGWFNVNTSLLRYWQKEFKILKPKKNKKGDRFFRPEDVKNLHLIYHLLREKKFSIEGAKKYLEADKPNADAAFELTKSLNKFRNFLLELKANLEK